MVANIIMNRTLRPLNSNRANPNATRADTKTSPNILGTAISTVFHIHLKIGTTSRALA